MSAEQIVITPVSSKRERKQFIDCAYRLNASDPNWVPPLRSEARDLITPGKNPFHEHARMQLFLAKRGNDLVGRISAHIDELALAQPVEQGMGPGTGNWGLLEAVDAQVTHALIETAEQWLRDEGMTRVLAPMSLSVWEEPGLLIKGHDHPPTVMMGHDDARHQGWIESAGYNQVKSLFTYELDITTGFPPLIERIVKSGERSSKINIRGAELKHFDRDAAIILGILNDAWSDNWGFVPFTEHEVEHAGKALKPLVREDLIMIAEVEGEPVAFMMTLPNLNEPVAKIGGKLFPFGWFTMLRWLRQPNCRTMRVPLMGVVKRLQSSRIASQLAFMMIEYIRRNAVSKYGAVRGELGWVLEDNQGMVAIAEAIESTINKEYAIYEKAL